MTTCPICKSVADSGRNNMGDFTQFDCPRCGKFLITGTALGMLSARLSDDDLKTRACMSHAVRALSDTNTNDEWIEITSLTVDELTKKPLPSINIQQANLLRWLATSLEDDQLGTITLPTENILASIVGALNGDRANKLVSLVEDGGFVRREADNRVMVTANGWKLLEPTPPDNSNIPKVVVTSAPQVELKTVKAHCNKCKGERSAFVRAAYTLSDNDEAVSWSNSYDILECCGCQNINIKHDFWFSEWDEIGHDSQGRTIMVPGVKTKYWPPPIRRTKPLWSSEINDEVLMTLFNELHVALDSDLLVLSTIGARTLFDRASFLQVGDSLGGFAGKIEAMVNAGHISATEKDILSAMTDAGNAAAHRGYAPTYSQLMAIVDILENYIQRSQILSGVAEALKKSTPPRSAKK